MLTDHLRGSEQKRDEREGRKGEDGREGGQLDSPKPNLFMFPPRNEKLSPSLKRVLIVSSFPSDRHGMRICSFGGASESGMAALTRPRRRRGRTSAFRRTIPLNEGDFIQRPKGESTREEEGRKTCWEEKRREEKEGYQRVELLAGEG